ncbi:MAG: DUF4393 domain-containing protein [Solirubrobacteraceae bacterium]|nr:DUF4393 domain-containing protein [Solirubrobacteraceae bacterium]
MTDNLPELASTAREMAPDVVAAAKAIGLATGAKHTVGGLTDRLYYRREERRAHLVTEVASRLTAAGVAPCAVQDPILHAVMEYGALVDDPGLQEMWINLLAGAAASTRAVPPSYPDILRQLEPIEAAFLSVVEASQGPIDGHHARILCDVPGLDPFDALEWRHLDNLERLQLIDYRLVAVTGNFPIKPLDRPEAVTLGVNPLAAHLLDACRPIADGGGRS